ncbi:hypothetical protein WG66_004649 [Moniliophthora roreri]|nr:hypothetical protein WG66_004649 [Moniliophthora roreri]
MKDHVQDQIPHQFDPSLVFDLLSFSNMEFFAIALSLAVATAVFAQKANIVLPIMGTGAPVQHYCRSRPSLQSKLQSFSQFKAVLLPTGLAVIPKTASVPLRYCTYNGPYNPQYASPVQIHIV